MRSLNISMKMNNIEHFGRVVSRAGKGLNLLLAMGIVCGLFACSSGEEATKNAVEEVDRTQIIITKMQFDDSKMKLGNIFDTVFHQLVSASGYVDVPERNKAVLGSYFGGKVAAIYVVTGQEVQQGQSLIAIENPDILDIQQDFIETQAQAKNLQAIYERLKLLASDNVGSQKELQQAESEFVMATARQQSLEEKLRLMQIDPAKLHAGTMSAQTIIRAPFSGSVAQIMTTTGQWLSESDPAIELINTSRFIVRMNVFEKDLSYLKVDQAVHIMLPDRPDLPFVGQISHLSKKVNQQQRTAVAMATITEGATEAMLPGMFVNGNIEVSDLEVDCLPEDAVVDIDGRYFALTLLREEAEQYVFKKVEVFPGRSMGKMTEINRSEAFTPETKFLISGVFQLLKAEE